MVQISSLIAIAGGCGMGLGCMVLLLRQQTERFANQAVFIQNALNIMEDQPAVKSLLGNSYQVGTANLEDGFTKVEQLKVKVRLPIKGENDTAQMFAYAKKRSEKDKFRLCKLEMTFDKIQGKKLVLLDLDSVDPLDDLLDLDSKKSNANNPIDSQGNNSSNKMNSDNSPKNIDSKSKTST